MDSRDASLWPSRPTTHHEAELPHTWCVAKSSTSQRGKQIRRGRALLRELKATLEDLEDRRELAAAKKRNAGRPGTSLRAAAKELGL
jgi:hypothetical protein